ncbi:MAG TPA: hypothetical protein VFU63_08570 [Ktedonobacterales bacterium]|jgi:hypothetical protein|nr:hypothetical protein [Ktedonobacterales bacterium]
MDELINQVVQKAGISQDQAHKAVDTVVGFLKDRLPGPIASQLDSVLGKQGGSSDIASRADQALGGLGDILGGNKP